MSDFYLKRGDRLPSLRANLLDADSAAVDLTGATVRFHLYGLYTRTLTTDAAAVVEEAEEGSVRYDWQTDDVADAGEYYAEFEATFGDGKTLTFPNDQHLQVTITDDLD